jgi:hypothetical protein
MLLHKKKCEKRLLALSCPSVRPTAGNNSAPTGWIFVEFYIEGFY